MCLISNLHRRYIGMGFHFGWKSEHCNIKTLHVSCLNAVSHALSSRVFATVLFACFTLMCLLLPVINRSTEINWTISCANLKRFNFRFGQLVWNICSWALLHWKLILLDCFVLKFMLGFTAGVCTDLLAFLGFKFYSSYTWS